MTLKDLKPGMSAVIEKVGGEGALRQHFLDMGVIPGVEITLIKYAPMGDPMELMIHGYELTLRLADAEQIEISELRKEEPEPEKPQENAKAKKAAKPKEHQHPRIGEVYAGHDYAEEHAAGPVNTGKLVFALAGNQNCGKTTLFNQLTGANQHVGNFPGVTVDRKSGSIRNHPDTEVVDLPGIYSLSPYTSEEIVSRQFILDEKPTAIINIIDATNIERNLYLTLQLMGLGIPMVLAVNMMDELRGNGGSVRINEMEELLQIPVVPISAAKNEGIDELVNHAIHVAAYNEKPGRVDFCDSTASGGAVHRAIHGVMHLIEDHCERAKIPVRFAASKLIEGDPLVEKALDLDENEHEMLGHIVDQMEKERGLDRAAAIADMRFSFIRKFCEETVVKPHESKEHERSRKIDEILTGKFTAIPLFIAIMAAVFFLTFNVIGKFFQDLLENGIGMLTDLVDGALKTANVAAPIQSLVIDAIFNGVGTVVSFVPIIVVLFFFLSILEDSGYMARVAFVMDKLLRKIGLSGRSIVPLLIGFGCSVPAAMSTRTLPSTRDRRMTTLLIPFMSCSAKTPIYAFICAAFFPKYAGLVMTGLYFLGILIAILVAYVSKSTVFKGEAVPFVMELPNYRMPGIKNVARLMWDKAKDFLSRAFTVIFIGTIIVWFLKTFDFRFNMVADSESMLASIAGFIAPVFAPVGLGDWRIVTSLIAGFLAKESIVSMLSVLYGSVGSLTSSLTPVDALALLVFCLLYTPCIAAVAAVKRERGALFATGTVIFQCAVAWVAALLVHLIGMLFI
ncbi:MAG: ferrous iron transport protein B [Saccharofermentans sp.]|nr:ferrous iron transport protein B [Saccharofermentans sp.]